MRMCTTSRALLSSTRRASLPAPIAVLPGTRARSTGSSVPSDHTDTALNPRWLSDAKQRIGKCITFGLRPAQLAEAGSILQETARDWRELVAGSEGYLTDPKRRGLYRRGVIWGEQDTMGHVNNVLYNRYAESGRIEWARKYGRFIDPEHARDWDGLMRPTELGLILRKITTEFKFPMTYPDHVTVYHKLGRELTADTEGFEFHVVILSELHQRPAARLVEDCVLYDYTQRRKTTFKPFMLDVLRETWRLQEEAKRVNSERVHDLLQRVRRLELGSWDREDAVEDMGSSRR